MMFSDPQMVGSVLGALGIVGLMIGLLATTRDRETDWQEIISYYWPSTLMVVSGITIYIFG
jgi:hypothetical protein